MDEFFTFTIDGEEFTMPEKTLDVITFGFIRKNRRRPADDYAFTALEALAGADDSGTVRSSEGRRILAALDKLDGAESSRIMQEFEDHLGAALGE